MSSVFDKFDIIIPCSATFFLEVGARLSLKLATKLSFRGKELSEFRFSGYFSKPKTEECDQKNWRFSNKFGMLMLGSNTYFLEVSAHVSMKVANKGSFRGKKSENLAFLRLFF